MPSYTVPYSALAIEVSLVKRELMRAVESVLDSGRYILGPETVAFEREFAEYCRDGEFYDDRPLPGFDKPLALRV